MPWLLLSALGFVAVTAVVIAMARADTARWEQAHGGRSRALVREHLPPRPLPHAHRRRREVHPAPVGGRGTSLPDPRSGS